MRSRPTSESPRHSRLCEAGDDRKQEGIHGPGDWCYLARGLLGQRTLTFCWLNIGERALSTRIPETRRFPYFLPGHDTRFPITRVRQRHKLGTVVDLALSNVFGDPGVVPLGNRDVACHAMECVPEGDLPGSRPAPADEHSYVGLLAARPQRQSARRRPLVPAVVAVAMNKVRHSALRCHEDDAGVVVRNSGRQRRMCRR
jgi:hypothetical protein